MVQKLNIYIDENDLKSFLRHVSMIEYDHLWAELRMVELWGVVRLPSVCNGCKMEWSLSQDGHLVTIIILVHSVMKS